MTRAGRARPARRLALAVAICAAMWLVAFAGVARAELEHRVTPAQRNVFISEIEAEEASLLAGQYLTGDWGGLRTKLRDVGITPTLSFVTDQAINTMPFFVNGGLVYRGPFDARPLDKAALGVLYGAFSDQLQRSQRDAQHAGVGAGPQRYELGFELTYIIQATRWLQVQPDLQYIVNPGGTGKIRDALVIGFQLAVNL
jgi:carbohydrate-selective porin OprB